MVCTLLSLSLILIHSSPSSLATGQRQLNEALWRGADAKYQRGELLSYVAQEGLAEMARLLLRHGANPSARDSALMTAADNGRSKVAALLLRRGARVNAKNSRGWTALHYAAQSLHNQALEHSRKQRGRPGIYATSDPLGTVKVLLRAGANANARDNEGWTPVMLAANDHFPAMVRALIAKGANLNIRDSDGCRILTYIHDDGTIRLLRQAGAQY